MQVNVTFRHVDPTAALRAYAEEKLARVNKYLRRPVDAHVILSVSKERHVAEITLNADHVILFAQEETHDLYSAIDLALDKLEHQAQKVAAKRKHHKGGPALRGPEPAPSEGGDRGAEPVRIRRVPARLFTVDEAVEQLAASRDEFLVFTDVESRQVAVLYRRKDGGYGLIEPEGR